MPESEHRLPRTLAHWTMHAENLHGISQISDTVPEAFCDVQMLFLKIEQACLQVSHGGNRHGVGVYG